MLKIKNLSLVFLASILPDISFLGIAAGMSIFKIDETSVFIYFSPFHTPFILILIALAIAFSTKKPKESFIVLCFGLLIHLTLDFFQKGNSILIFYPFSLAPYSYGVFWQEDKIVYLFQILGFFLLAYAFLKEKVQLKIDYRKRLIIFCLIIAIIPSLTENMMLKNFYYYQFINSPENWKGNIILTNRVVVSENPIKIKVPDHQDIEIVTSEKLQVGDIVAVEGPYKDGKIYADNIHVQEVFYKEMASFTALFLFIHILFRNQILNSITRFKNLNSRKREEEFTSL